MKPYLIKCEVCGKFIGKDGRIKACELYEDGHREWDIEEALCNRCVKEEEDL